MTVNLNRSLSRVCLELTRTPMKYTCSVSYVLELVEFIFGNLTKTSCIEEISLRGSQPLQEIFEIYESLRST